MKSDGSYHPIKVYKTSKIVLSSMEVITMQCFKDLTFAVSGKVKLSFGH